MLFVKLGCEGPREAWRQEAARGQYYQHACLLACSLARSLPLDGRGEKERWVLESIQDEGARA